MTLSTHKYARSMTLFLAVLFSPTNVALGYDIPKAEKSPVLNEGTEHLLKISKGISTVAAHAKKGIVFVSVSKIVKGMPYGMVNPFDFFFGPQPGRPPQKAPEQKQKGLGSGFFIDLEKGYILTNNHVIDGADEISLKLANGESYDAKVVGRDKNTDIAVVQIKGSFKKEGLVQLALGDSTSLEVGNICVALGAPFGLEASVSLGVVSALGRGSLSITELGDFIQTDAAINPGNSGGPLLSATGNVIGINTAIFSKSGGYNGIGFAIPSNLVRTVANQLINTGKIMRGYLGVVLSEMDADLARELGIPKKSSDHGALIRSVEPGSPADNGGVKDGDVVIDINGKKIRDVQQLRTIIGLYKPSTKVNLTIYRNRKQKKLTVKLGSYNDTSVKNSSTDESPSKGFGLSLRSVNSGLKKKYQFRSNSGAVVVRVDPNSSADRAGLQEGDVIIKLNRQRITSSQQFWKHSKSNSRILIRIERQGQNMFIPLRR